METNLWQRCIKPRDCVLALALPTTRATFERCRRRREGSFANLFIYWERYQREVMRPLDKVLPRMLRLGAHVVHDLALRDFGELFLQDFPVIILMAHWKPGAVELADGFASVEAMIENVPPEAERIIDLAVCRPEPLTVALRRLRPRCLTRFSHADATPALWTYFYYALLHQLRHQDLTYMNAVERTISHFRSESHEIT